MNGGGTGSLGWGDCDCDREGEDLVWTGWGCGGGVGTLDCDLPCTPFPGWPSSRSNKLVGGFLLTPISAREDVPTDNSSTSDKSGSPRSSEGSSDGSAWSNTPNPSPDKPKSPSSSVAWWDGEEPANGMPWGTGDPSEIKNPCSATVIF